MVIQNNILDYQEFLTQQAGVHSAFKQASKPRTVPKDKIIVAQNETDKDMFLLRKGSAKVVIYSKGGNEIHLAELLPGTLFGEMATLLNAPRSSNVIAQTDCTLDIISATDFNALMRRFPELALYMTKMLAQRLQQTSQILFESHAFTIPQRIYQDLLRRSEPNTDHTELFRLVPAPSVTTISENLNVSREAASRAVTKLTRQGLVKKQKGYWDIIRPNFEDY